MTLTKEWLAKFSWPATLLTGHPLALAHRGASAYGPENTLKAFRIAADLCSELWELDVHLSADGVCVVSHDDDLGRISGQNLRISQSNWEQICEVKLPEGQHVCRLEEVIALARETGCGLYVEIKSSGAGVAAWRILQATEFKFACLASFKVNWISELRDLGCTYPLGVLVPVDVDAKEYVGDVEIDIVHICWRNVTDRPDMLLTEALLQQLSDYQIVLWDEDRPTVLNGMINKPIMGICSNRPEMLKPYRKASLVPIDIVCHRGAHNLAPENTLEAAKICIDQGFQFIELDVRTARDGELVVIHDAELERTTSGRGLVADNSFEVIQKLDAGHWFRHDDAKHVVSTLAEFLELARGKCGIYVEIKKADAKTLLSAINRFGMLDQCFFWSADVGTLIDLRRAHSEIQLMVPRWIFSSLEVAIGAYGATIVEFNVEMDDLEEIARCKELGIKTMIYSRRDSWGEMATYLKYKPDLVNLDYPDRFKIVTCYPLVRHHFDIMIGENATLDAGSLNTEKFAVNL